MQLSINVVQGTIKLTFHKKNGSGFDPRVLCAIDDHVKIQSNGEVKLDEAIDGNKLVVAIFKPAQNFSQEQFSRLVEDSLEKTEHHLTGCDVCQRRKPYCNFRRK